MQLNKTNYTQLKYTTFYMSLALMMLMNMSVFAQENETEQDSTKTTFALGKLNMPNPNSIVSKYTYDPILDRYIYTEKIGNFNINYLILNYIILGDLISPYITLYVFIILYDNLIRYIILPYSI